ncbi:MAG: hypothetical protein CMI29_09020 [Opitutae bacterium]|nr:hypothetical protein [Opitutae bacterium]|tara:strand:- start:8512 stop:8799 length:288 start_codon:yes stop_codon:yes gene_type:complete
MATNEKTDALFTEYKRGQYPQIEEGIRRYIQDELQRIEISLQSAASTAVQVVDKPPQNPLKGHIRFAVSPWDPLSTGYSGLVVYDGNNWRKITIV